MRVETRAHRRAADRQIVKSVEHLLESVNVALKQAGPSAEFLAYGQWHRVLQVSAADFYDVSNSFALAEIASRTLLIAGISAFFTRSAAAMCMAAGNVSFDDCDMLT